MDQPICWHRKLDGKFCGLTENEHNSAMTHAFVPVADYMREHPEHFGIGPRDDARKGDWVCTYEGREFYPLDPRAEDVSIDDIAHSLSMQCRFNGHCRYFYSVGQHSILVHDLVERVIAGTSNNGSTRELLAFQNATSIVPTRRDGWHARMWALLHDASEAYLSDIPRPLKCDDMMIGYVLAESVVEQVIAQKWRVQLNSEVKAVVKWADNVLLRNEAMQLMPRESAQRWNMPDYNVNIRIMPWTPRATEDAYKRLFYSILHERGHDE